GDFTITANTCGSSLAAQTGCTVSLVFAPKSSGAHSGSFTITGDGKTLSAALSGDGVLPATDALAPTLLAFAAQALGTSSAAQRVTLTNSGDVALTLIAATASDGFTATNGCGNSLAAHSSCAIVVVFQPKTLGAVTGTLTVSDQYRSQTVALAGTGIAPAGVSLAPLFGVSFAATGVGLTSAPQTVTLTNNGGVALEVSSIAVSGDFNIVAGSNTCGASLAPGVACTMQVAFTPTVAGARNGTLTVASSAANSPHTLALSGAAVDFALAANGPTAATVASGQSATYSLLYTPGPMVAGAAVQVACSGLPVFASCHVNPAALAVDGNAIPIAVTVVTGDMNAAMRGGGNAALAMLLAPAFVFMLRRRRVVPAMLLCALMVVAGCGAGRTIPSSGGPSGGGGGVATPAGAYNITVTATGSGLTRSVSLTLNVK
ncbi:MAG TPA: choice-of-anchor D domain-containing protein, partial [Edaphobacter sp.]